MRIVTILCGKCYKDLAVPHKPNGGVCGADEIAGCFLLLFDEIDFLVDVTSYQLMWFWDLIKRFVGTETCKWSENVSFYSWLSCLVTSPNNRTISFNLIVFAVIRPNCQLKSMKNYRKLRMGKKLREWIEWLNGAQITPDQIDTRDGYVLRKRGAMSMHNNASI